MIDYGNNNIEISELQAVDFALGTFIAKAFTGQRPDSGSKEWREFLTRNVKQQIYRGDHDDPAEFVKTLQQTTKQTVQFPIIYYFRKPGFTNADNNKAIHAKGVTNSGKSYDLVSLPISLDYRFYILAWDKPTLDKLSLAWYAYVNAKNARFTIKYMIDGELFDEIPANIADSRTVTMSDNTPQPAEPGKRPAFYGVMTGMTINTQILVGTPVPAPPDNIFIEIGLLKFRTVRYPVATADGVATAFTFDTSAKFGKPAQFRPQYVEIHAGTHYVGSDNGNGLLSGIKIIEGTTYTLSGAVVYNAGIAYPVITPPLPANTEISIKYGTDQNMVGSECPGCHNYKDYRL